MATTVADVMVEAGRGRRRRRPRRGVPGRGTARRQAGRGAVGLFGARVDKADQLEDVLREAFGHDGPALVEVRTARQELSLPPKLTYGEIKGFTSTRPGPSCPQEEKNSSRSPRPTGGNLTPNDEATRIRAGDFAAKRLLRGLRRERLLIYEPDSPALYGKSMP
jgi:hypothetical protein